MLHACHTFVYEKIDDCIVHDAAEMVYNFFQVLFEEISLSLLVRGTPIYLNDSQINKERERERKREREREREREKERKRESTTTDNSFLSHVTFSTFSHMQDNVRLQRII